MKPSIFARIEAWLRGARLVWLEDHDGEFALSYAVVSPFGRLVAPRYTSSPSLRTCELLPDGTIKGGGYVSRWRYA
jgi:hypothetical protein